MQIKTSYQKYDDKILQEMAKKSYREHKDLVKDTNFWIWQIKNNPINFYNALNGSWGDESVKRLLEKAGFKDAKDLLNTKFTLGETIKKKITIVRTK